MSVGWRRAFRPIRAAIKRASAAVRCRAARLLALAGVAAVLGAVLSVLYGVVVITGNPAAFLLVVVVSVLAGTLAARLIRPRTATLLALAAGVCGSYLYIRSLPGSVDVLALVAPILGDAVALLSGLSILRIVNADIWAFSAVPVPVFLSCYLALRRRYVAASAVSGVALGLLALTGDATTGETLAGVVGATVAAAVGDCERRGERLIDADGVAMVVAVMLVSTLFIGVVPGAIGSVLPAAGGGSTVESSLVYADDSVSVVGSIELSPERRYVVEADEAAYWRVGTYDRYTGDGWVRSGSTQRYDGPIPGPPGESRTLEQTYTTASSVATLPAARRPTRIGDVPVPVRVTDGGSFEPVSPLQAGESYRVESEVPTGRPDEFRAAGTGYPEGIETRYTQLPSDTPDRVAERTARLTANAENPYDTARVLEYWFRTEYEYSLDVDRPRGNVADAFLFEMESGYCVYFATTMVTMLRTQGIPARFAVGYTPGEAVDDDEWVVRGYNSHAWVEVYVPEHGWIKFDPTPATPRQETEQAILDDGDGNDEETTGAETATPAAEAEAGTADTPTPGGGDTGDVDVDPIAAADQSAAEDDRPLLPSVPLPSGETVAAALVAVLAVLAVRRRGLGERVYRIIWLRRLPRGDPDDVVVGAYRRAVYLEERRGSEKIIGETPRQFLGGDERLERIAERYERVRYGGGVDETAAVEARADLADLLAERSRLPWRRETPEEGSR
ncbi:MAG: transglutaminase-like putative cysteine protease [Natronomonas sp.]|jgi:transglutaminase-like putative cysteine protease|uniref:transglutaminase family protein n=1 Tax=Natronomonas sp. TaxID=2184060 RepID=UPI003988E9F1